MDGPAPSPEPGRGISVREALLLGGAAAGARLLCILRTVAPDRDAAWYAWAARAFRDGRPADALASVFPPLHPLLAAPLGLLDPAGGAGWWRILQAGGLLWDTAAILLLFDLLARRGGRRTALFACAWWALGMLPAWTVADGMSGPLFRFLLVLGLRGFLLGPWWLSSLAVGLAALTRPEGLALLPMGLAAAAGKRERTASRFRLPAAFLLLLGPRLFYLFARKCAVGVFLLFPKGELMTHLSAWAEGGLLPGIGHWIHQAGRFLLQGFDGLGYLAWPLLPAGAYLLFRKDSRGKEDSWKEAWPLPLLLAAAALAVVPFYFGNRRFWTPWLPILLPAAALPMARLGSRSPWRALILAALALAPHTVRLAFPRRPSLAPLVRLGPRIAGALGRGRPSLEEEDPPPPWAAAGLAADLPRLYLFAGLRPPAPRSIPAGELQEAARSRRVRFAASMKKRRKLPPALMESLGFRLAVFGPELDRALERGGFVVWERP